MEAQAVKASRMIPTVKKMRADFQKSGNSLLSMSNPVTKVAQWSSGEAPKRCTFVQRLKIPSVGLYVWSCAQPKNIYDKEVSAKGLLCG